MSKGLSTRDLGANVSRSSLHAETVEQYGTDGFLQTMKWFTSLRGYPVKIYSDSRNQLVAANKELKGMCEKLDEQQLQEFGAEKGWSRHFASPNAPWKNGCAESLIKSIKKAIKIAVGKHILSFPELQTVLFEAANIVSNVQMIYLWGLAVTAGSIRILKDALHLSNL